MLFQLTINPLDILPTDFFTFILPWVFSFAVFYGLLEKLDIFGKLKKQVNLILSLIFAFFVAAAGGPQIAEFFMNILGNFIVVLVGLLVLLVFLQLIGKDLVGENAKFNDLVVIGTLILGGLLFFGSGGEIPGLNLDSTQATFIFWGAILIVAIYYVTRSEN